MSKRLTIETHFTEAELSCRCGCGKMVEEDLLVRLEALRRIVNRPLIITSGARCEEYNRKIGGKPKSWHLHGLAVDVACTNTWDRFALIHAAQQLGFNGIGIAENFIHLDLRPVDVGRVWLYS